MPPAVLAESLFKPYKGDYIEIELTSLNQLHKDKVVLKTSGAKYLLHINEIKFSHLSSFYRTQSSWLYLNYM